MIKYRINKYFILQILLGILIFSTGFLKAIDFDLFIADLSSYNVFPKELITIFASAIIMAEIVIGYSLIFGIKTKIVSKMLIFMLVIFLVFNIYSIVFETNWVCSCFGGVFRGKISFITILRDFIFLLLTIFVYFKHLPNYSFNNFSNGFSNFILVLFIILCTSLFFFLTVNTSNKKKLEVGEKLTDFKFESVEGFLIDINNRDPVPMLIIAVDPNNDCTNCLVESFFWEKVYKTFGNKIMVVGIIAAPNKKYVQVWTGARKLSFPFIYDVEKQFWEKYSFRTPMKIVVSQTNEILFIQKSRNREDEKKEFTNKLKEILK